NHQDLEIFGSGDDTSAQTWTEVFRQAIIAGYFDKDIENYGLLKVTKKGTTFLDKPVSFKISKIGEEDEDEENMDDVVVKSGEGASAVDPVLFSIMKDLRKKMAKKLNVPPYVIFQ